MIVTQYLDNSYLGGLVTELEVTLQDSRERDFLFWLKYGIDEPVWIELFDVSAGVAHFVAPSEA